MLGNVICCLKVICSLKVQVEVIKRKVQTNIFHLFVLDTCNWYICICYIYNNIIIPLSTILHNIFDIIITLIANNVQINLFINALQL